MGDALNTDLGDYLRGMRERTRPEEIGLVSRGTRRVKGLRREEVAALAGVSPSYYTRLEQSQTAHASPSILRAIARALGLAADDEEYLLKIGTPAENWPLKEPAVGQLSPFTTMLVNSLSNVAVAVVDFRCDILAWNPLYHRLFAPHLDAQAPTSPDTRPNIIKLNFLDEVVRKTYLDWRTESHSNVAYLRFVAANHREDRRLAELVHELTSGSEEFADLWRSQDVANCANGTKAIEHPVVGRVELMYESADLRDGNVIKFFHVQPGTSDEAALALLASDRDTLSRV